MAEKLNTKVTAKEMGALSQNMQRDLEAMFNVAYDEILDKIEQLDKGKITIDEFLLYIDSL